MSNETDWQALFAKYPSLTTREFGELSRIAWSDWDTHLETLHAAGILYKLTTKNGVLWQLKGSRDACTP